MRPLGALVALALASVVFVVACGSEAIGASCDDIGKSTGECEEGGVCSRDTDGAAKCLRICNAITDCPSGTRCGDLEGSPLKGCKSAR